MKVRNQPKLRRVWPGLFNDLITTILCFESETERNHRMQFFVRNPREGHTKLIRNIPVTTDKLIYEIVINFDKCKDKSNQPKLRRVWPGLFNDLITTILDVFRKTNIYGPKGKNQNY
jgi:hypothetical protein